MSLTRPVGHTQTSGLVTQPFYGTFDWEPSGYMRSDLSIWRGARFWFNRHARKYAHIHLAVDFGCPVGTPVRAVHDGKIIAQFIDVDGAVVIYQQVKVGRIFKVVAAYWHLKRGSFRFRTGTFVRAGQVIALSGDTGHTKGAHLHFEIWRMLRATPISLMYHVAMRFDPMAFILGKDLTEIC